VLPRDSNQREMTFMEESHRRNDGDGPTRGARTAERGPRLFDGSCGDQFFFGIGTTTESP
jgi:hypothetical protein